MRFKQYINELANIEVGQAVKAHEPMGEDSIDILNPKVEMEINTRLMVELREGFVYPESGIQKIRKVLHTYGLDMPALYEIDPEGDEIAIEVNQYGIEGLDSNIYILYYLTDEGHYEFYAEIGDDERMDELMSEEIEE